MITKSEKISVFSHSFSLYTQTSFFRSQLDSQTWKTEIYNAALRNGKANSDDKTSNTIFFAIEKNQRADIFQY